MFATQAPELLTEPQRKPYSAVNYPSTISHDAFSNTIRGHSNIIPRSFPEKRPSQLPSDSGIIRNLSKKYGLNEDEHEVYSEFLHMISNFDEGMLLIKIDSMANILTDSLIDAKVFIVLK